MRPATDMNDLAQHLTTQALSAGRELTEHAAGLSYARGLRHGVSLALLHLLEAPRYETVCLSRIAYATVILLALAALKGALS